jgi:hypothetical protein
VIQQLLCFKYEKFVGNAHLDPSEQTLIMVAQKMGVKFWLDFSTSPQFSDQEALPGTRKISAYIAQRSGCELSEVGNSSVHGDARLQKLDNSDAKYFVVLCTIFCL